MKRFLCVILIAILLITLSGCYYKQNKAEKSENDGRITLLYNDGFAIIYQDNETGVQYFSRMNAGTCVVVNPDGTPYIRGIKNSD